MLSEIIDLGKRIYNTDHPREFHRFLVFLGRSILHASEMKQLYTWFQQDEQRQLILKKSPWPMEQVTRAFFYAGSTFAERKQLIMDHFTILAKKLQPEWVVRLGCIDGCYTLWKPGETDVDWSCMLTFEPGQRKEGLLAVKMLFDKQDLYQMMVWLAYNAQHEPSLYIGAMQGPNMEHARDVVKDVTKRSYRYRTKNLILYMTQAVARGLGLKHIYAVTNQGYYAQNHMRRDRKLKTDFGDFWLEAGGWQTDDARWDELPLVEPRKAMEEVPTRKRAVYRKRFAFLDDVDAQIQQKVEKIRK